MRRFATSLIALILATWMGAAAILAVQNFTPVSFKILTFQSIQVPFGVVLAFSAGLGAVGTAIAPLLFGGMTNSED